jgi:drug/metabolite transporter (DMT)-like permease
MPWMSFKEKDPGLLLGASPDRPMMAASLLVGALFLLGLQDAMIKWTTSDISLWYFNFLRAGLNMIFLILFVRVFRGGVIPPSKSRFAVALRSLLLCGAMIFFFSGIPFLSLAEVASGLYVFPLFVALLSRFVLGERVGPRRVIAILIGFTGTLLILKPGTEAFTPFALLPVVAGFLYACTILATRSVCREESSLTLANGVSVAFLVLSAIALLVLGILPTSDYAQAWPYLFTGWEPLDLWVFGVIAFCSTLNLAANVGLAKAYQTAEASWLAPFDYSYLVFATFWGFAIWRDIPDGLMFVGMLLIAGSGAFVALRQKPENTGQPNR